MKRSFKKILNRSGRLMSAYEALRAFYHRTRKLAFYLTDARQTYRDMRWSKGAYGAYWAKSSELLFQYHKLEKGLCMPGERRIFGIDAAVSTLTLLNEWRTAGFLITDPVYLGALETLHAYRTRLRELQVSTTDALTTAIDAELKDNPARHPELQTPCPAEVNVIEGHYDLLSHLAHSRRSVRDFTSKSVSVEVLQKAIRVAQLSPSACNRQPWRIHHYEHQSGIRKMLSLQNGNRGFGHTVKTLLVLTADATAFFDASERNEPYVDGGLFAMSLILALQAQGVASCCLNWCVEPKQDSEAHALGNIPGSERIIMYIAVGYAAMNALVPRSPRRGFESTFTMHG